MNQMVIVRVMNILKKIVKDTPFLRLIFIKLFKQYNLLLNDDIELLKVKNFQQAVISRIQAKKQIKVVFLVYNTAKWQYESVYQAMEKHPKFNPRIVIVPRPIWHKKKHIIEELEKTKRDFTKYKIVISKVGSRCLDIKRMLKPDLIFFADHNINNSKYDINRFYKTSLCCHVPYSYFISSDYNIFYNQPFHKLIWVSFTETSYHKDFANQYAVEQGRRFIHSGYPPMDQLIGFHYSSNFNAWPKAKPRQKKLIWAPHFSVDDDKRSASFLVYCDFMVDVARMYMDYLCISFKPHPSLKAKLYSLPNWGTEKTDDYFRLWSEMNNTQIDEGSYTDLFLQSDGLLHDGFSFIVEYLFVNKPLCYIYKNVEVNNVMNPLGQKALGASYKSHNKAETIQFIEDVLLEGNDSMANNRVDLVKKVLYPPNNQSAAQNIVDFIIKELNLN